MRLYHGTGADITGRVERGSLHPGRSVHGDDFSEIGQRSSDHAFATADEHTAWGFADAQSNRHGGRARVYEVHEHPDMKPGVFNAKAGKNVMQGQVDLAEYVAPHFDVKDRIDTKPGHQGTFPHLNWNQFRAQGSSGDANHPSNDETFGPKTLPARPPMVGDVHPEQRDLFTGRTVASHSEHPTDLGFYHLNRQHGF